jgi:hypothetical protein
MRKNININQNLIKIYDTFEGIAIEGILLSFNLLVFPTKD